MGTAFPRGLRLSEVWGKQHQSLPRRGSAAVRSDVLHPCLAALSLLRGPGDQTWPEAPGISPLLMVFVVGCVSADSGSLGCWLLPGYQKHLGHGCKAASLSWEPGSALGLRECWKAFPRGSRTLPSVTRSDGEEGVSVRHGSFFLPVSSINLNAKTQTLWNAAALQRAPACSSVWPGNIPQVVLRRHPARSRSW